jgi:hypothetical protein
VSAPLPVRRKVDNGDDLDHFVCCNDNLGLCGADLSDAAWAEELPNLCVVCDDLDSLPCERCGE